MHETQDTSTGEIIAQNRTRLGTCDVLRQNPWNGVMHLGHSNGVVSMWTPNMSTPVVKMLCHKVGLPRTTHSSLEALLLFQILPGLNGLKGSPKAAKGTAHSWRDVLSTLL